MSVLCAFLQSMHAYMHVERESSCWLEVSRLHLLPQPYPTGTGRRAAGACIQSSRLRRLLASEYSQHVMALCLFVHILCCRGVLCVSIGRCMYVPTTVFACHNVMVGGCFALTDERSGLG